MSRPCGRKGERDGEETREKGRGERETATMRGSSCQPGRAFTVWSYLGKRETRCECRGGRGMRRGTGRQADGERESLTTSTRLSALQAATDTLMGN